MKKINRVFERKDILVYLESRQILKQYLKAKKHILNGKFSIVQLKKRKAKNKGVWYFRINKQYRAIAYFDTNDLIVVKIDDHS